MEKQNIKMKYLIIIIPVILVIILVSYLNYSSESENTTECIQIVAKSNSDIENWIEVSNDKKIYIEDISIWALINENQFYTISYVLNEKNNKYYLKSIVPANYNGQF